MHMVVGNASAKLRNMIRFAYMRLSNISGARSKKGFTIIELLVVVAIIGMLIAAMVVGLTTSRSKGRLASALQAMKGVHARNDMY